MHSKTSLQLSTLLQREGVSPDKANALEKKVIAQYEQNQLPYHNLEHIHHTLSTASTLLTTHSTQSTETEQAHSSALFVAIWFHDVIYDAQESDNEEASADYAQQELTKLNLSPTLVHMVQTLILDTKHHQPSTPTGETIVDADLAILGASKAAYQAYATAIRQEYSWVPEDAYRHGRAQVLQRFLQRESIYHTATAKQKWEAIARENLHQEILQLTR